MKSRGLDVEDSGGKRTQSPFRAENRSMGKLEDDVRERQDLEHCAHVHVIPGVAIRNSWPDQSNHQTGIL